MQPAVANRYFLQPTLLALTLLFLLSGCGDRVELHRQLSEQEANEVIAELADKHIRARKIPTKDGVTVSVDTNDIGRAVRTLEAVGLPNSLAPHSAIRFAKRALSLRHWKSARATSTPYPKSSKPPCRTSTVSSLPECVIASRAHCARRTCAACIRLGFHQTRSSP